MKDPPHPCCIMVWGLDNIFQLGTSEVGGHQQSAQTDLSAAVLTVRDFKTPGSGVRETVQHIGLEQHRP